MAEILLIDDDRNMHQIVSLFLEHAGHEVHSALNGEVGLRLATQEHPDLILLDLAMPGMNGFEVLNRLKASAITARVPVVLFTVHEPEEWPHTPNEHDLAGFLKKPVDMFALQAGVEMALKHASALH